MVTKNNPRLLIFSQRNILRGLSRCAHHEFEDILCGIDSAELLAPRVDGSALRRAISTRITYHAPLVLNPGIERLSPRGHYDLFFAVCGLPQDLVFVNAVRGWRKTCEKSICLIDELWVKEMDVYRHFLPILEEFDVVVLYYSQSIKSLSERIGRKCVFLPPGVDALRFCPYPRPPKRVIDIYNMGRRSETTHRRLCRMADEKGIFYLYDTIHGDYAMAANPGEHRRLMASIAKRCRYFMVNPALMDQPDKRGDQMEIGNRYFEGAASGTIMVGERVDNGKFESLFDWPDAVIQLPYGSEDVEDLIEALDRQPERQARIRRDNVVQALMRHDWVYRWEAILKAVDLEPLPGLYQRKEQLAALAKLAKQDGPLASPASNRQEVGRTLHR